MMRTKTISLFCIVVMLISIIGIMPTYANSTNLEAFPESYRPYIQAMLKAHPNWVFEPYNTGIEWSELVSYQAEKDRNLIDKTANPEKYFSKASGNYDASTGTYIGKSGPNWVVPNDETIKHYLDPRNFLNDSDVFMFLKLDYNANVHTSKNVEVLLGSSWMHNRKLEDDSSMTYADAFVKTGKETGVSSFFLAARVMQEQGSGTSALISGTYPGYEGYYNYFNHGAYGSTTSEIIVNGLASAKANGWNTRYKSLAGGAATLSTKYIARKQYTLYFQKFDVVDGISYHQYMQNIQAPLSEGHTMRKAYNNVGLLDAAYVFSVPVYNNMPASACPLPGEEIVKIPPSATLSAGAVDRNAGTMTVNVSNVVTDSGIKRILIKAYSEANGADDIHSYDVSRNSDGSYSAVINIANHNNEYGKYIAEVYIMDNTNYEECVGTVEFNITQLKKPTLTVVQYQNTLKLKLSNIDSAYNISAVRFPVWSNENGQDDLLWYNGVKNKDYWVCTVNLDSHRTSELLITVHAYMTDNSVQTLAAGRTVKIRKSDPLWGDVNFDGYVNASDALEVLKAASSLVKLDDEQKAAADVNFDEICNASDALLILKNAVNLAELPQINW